MIILIMTEKEKLYRLIDDGYTLVFPTEESARVFSVSYVLDLQKGLLADSVIAFDKFEKLFYPDDGRSEITDSQRIVFSYYAAENLSGLFRYFVSEDHPEIKGRLHTFIASMLGRLDEVMSVTVRKRDALADAMLVRAEYSRYLSELNLRDKVLEEPFIPADLGKYAIVMPSAFPKERKLLKLLSSSGNVRFIDSETSLDTPLYVFSNEKSEIRAMFLKIRKLIDNGTDLSDIVIVTAALERVSPYLEKEAYLHDIPLDFVSGASPLSYPAGSFLSMLRDIYQSHYSIESLKSLFLDPAIPFSRPDALRAFIARAISDSVSFASAKDDRYARIDSEEIGDIYRTFRKDLDALMRETRPERITPLLHALMSHMLIKDQFNGNEDDKDTYSFAMNALQDFLADTGKAGSAGFGFSIPLFPEFISYLEGIMYVPRKKAGGIKIYPFTQDAAVYAPYRFIISLNESDGAKRVKDAAFFSDYELDERGEEDITENILRAYDAFSDNLYLSAASETYEGAVLPLMKLRQEKGNIDLDDPWRYECSLTDGRIYPLQREGFDKAMHSSLKRRIYSEDIARGMNGKPEKGTLMLSFSKVDKYRQCPFAYAMRYRFLLDENRHFVSEETDNLEIGTRLHSVMEQFYKEGGRWPEKRIPEIFDQEMDLWQDGKRHGDDGSIVSVRASDLRPSQNMVINIRKRFLQNMIDLAIRMNDEAEVFEDGVERNFRSDSEGHGYILDGKADRIASMPEGLVIYDYKKGRAFSKDKITDKSLQFYIYRLLVERELSMHVARASFVTLTDGKISDIDLSESDDYVLSVLDEAAEGMRKGSWTALPDEDKCGSCSFRMICRRRFTVQ